MSEGERDLRFEVQYILSLSLVVFGLISVPGVREGIDVWTAYPIILFLAIHLSVFTLVYSIGKTGFTVDLVEAIEDLQIFPFIGAAFAFFILHSVFAILHSHLSAVEYYRIAANYSPLPIFWTTGEIVIKYVVPIVLVGIMGYSVKRRGFDPLDTFEGINIKVVPEFIRAFPAPGESKALLVKVENNGDETFGYELDINIPDIVTLHKQGEPVVEQFSDSQSLSPGQAKRYSFEVSHISEDHTAEELDVKINAGGASFSETVELELAV